MRTSVHSAGMSDRPLTVKQQRFVDVYDGNATQAAADAGYAGNRQTLEAVGRKLLGNTRIARAIHDRQEKEARPYIMSRLERQAMWTQVAQDTEQDIRARLKASELLGRSEADFIDTTRHQDADGGKLGDRRNMTDAELLAILSPGAIHGTRGHA